MKETPNRLKSYFWPLSSAIKLQDQITDIGVSGVLKSVFERVS